MLDYAERRLCAAATMALAAGAAVYLCRGFAPLPALVAWTGALPTLLHTVAFAGLSLAVTAPWPRLAPLVCAGWLVLEGGFEVLQIDAVAASLQSSVLARDVPLFAAYLRGTFDPLDLAAALAGTLAAAWLARRGAAGVRTCA
jgi:hypothetical protein